MTAVLPQEGVPPFLPASKGHLPADQETALRWLGLAMELGNKVVVVTSPSGMIEYVNASFTKSTGYAAREVLGQSTRILKSGLMPEEVYRRMWTTLKSGQSWQGELLNRKKNGELYWEQAIISPMPEKDGIRYMAVKENITERKLLRGRLEMMQGVMRVLSTENTLTNAAPRLSRVIAEALAAGWVELWMYKPDELELLCEGSHVLGGTLGRHSPAAMAGTRLKRGSDERFLALDALSHVRLHAGEARHELAFPIRTGQGSAGLLIVGDLLNSQIVIPAIELVCAQLGHFVHRTHVEEDLIRARDSAEAANRAKAAFLSNMSQELRIPIARILEVSRGILRDKSLGSEALRQMELIERSGLELLAVMEAITDISRVVAMPGDKYPELHGMEGTNIDKITRLLEPDTELRPGSAEAASQREAGHEAPSKEYAKPIKELLSSISDASTKADIERVRRLTEDLAGLDPDLGMRVRQFADAYDYESIRALLRN